MDIDSKLEDRKYINSIYDQAKCPHPKKFKFEWYIDDLDLGVVDKKNNVFFNIHHVHM